MKKTIKIALLLCLISLVSILMFTACNSKDNPAPEESTSKETTTTPTPAHIWSEWIVIKEAKCEENGLLQRYCTECNYTESKPIDALGHTEVIDQAVAPTCTSIGITQGKHCSVCNEVFVAQTTIDVLGHSYTSTITPPTTTEDGYKLTYTCSNCGDVYTEAIVTTDVTITASNRTMIGYTGEAGENLIIPAVFQHNGTWYRVTTIGNSAFSSCDNLTSVTIPDSVTTIGNSAFYWCTNLASVTIGDSVTTIGNSAFLWCSNLTSITFEGTAAQWNAISKGDNWKYRVPATEVVCSDGTVTLY